MAFQPAPHSPGALERAGLARMTGLDWWGQATSRGRVQREVFSCLHMLAHTNKHTHTLLLLLLLLLKQLL